MARKQFPFWVLDQIRPPPELKETDPTTHERKSSLYNRLVLVLKATGQIPITYEDYEAVMSQLRAEHAAILERFGAENADLQAKWIAAHPDYRDRFQSAQNLYRVMLEAPGTKGSQVTRSGAGTGAEDDKPNDREPRAGHIFSDNLEELIAAAPRDFFTSDDVSVEAAVGALMDLGFKQTLRMFERDPKEALAFLEEKIRDEESRNLRTAYQMVRRHYLGYLNFQVPNANPQFRDPRTGAVGVLPSLHQKQGIYHCVSELRFGIFDDMGTGKTAQGALAADLIIEKLHSLGKPVHDRVLVICPNECKEAWQRGLSGGEHERYFAEQKRSVVLTGRKGELDTLSKDDAKGEGAEWVIVNPEKLPTQVHFRGKKKTLTEALIALGYDVLVADEAHVLRSTKGTAVYSTAYRLLALQQDADGDFIPFIPLTGTPIPDSMSDYCMMGHLLEPDRYPTPDAFKEEFKNDPRSISTVLRKKSLRRLSEEVTQLEALDRENAYTNMSDMQRIVYEYIMNNKRAVKNWLTQARKALIDPRLVNPEILQTLGLLGELCYEDAPKYNLLEDLVVEAVRAGEKVVLFSSEFKEGVTAPARDLERKYARAGLSEHFASLKLDLPRARDTVPDCLRAIEARRGTKVASLVKRLEDRLWEEFGNLYYVGVMDGDTSANGRPGRVSDRVQLMRNFRADDLHAVQLCTGDVGGQSWDMTCASFGVALDKNYTPSKNDQPEKRLHRKGQDRQVHFRYLMIQGDFLDEAVEKYEARKKLVIRIAVDGYPLTEEERKLFDDKSRLKEIQRNIGGTSQDLRVIDYTEAAVTSQVSQKKKRSTQPYPGSDLEITQAQLLRRMISPFINQGAAWNDPKLVAMYTGCMHTLSVYALHRARILYLMGQAAEGNIGWPEKVLAEGSGPSLLYHAFGDLKGRLRKAKLDMPEVWDRDLAPNMLAAGGNPNQIVGDMRGHESTIEAASFNLVDHESISLMRYAGDQRDAVLETSRILRPEGYALFGVKDIRFADSYYEGLEQAGFRVISPRHAELRPDPAFIKHLEQTQGIEFARRYGGKLRNSYFVLAQRVADPATTIDQELFHLERAPTEPIPERPPSLDESNGITGQLDPGLVTDSPQAQTRDYWVTKEGDMRFDRQPERASRREIRRNVGGVSYTIDSSGVVHFNR